MLIEKIQKPQNIQSICEDCQRLLGIDRDCQRLLGLVIGLLGLVIGLLGLDKLMDIEDTITDSIHARDAA